MDDLKLLHHMRADAPSPSALQLQNMRFRLVNEITSPAPARHRQRVGLRSQLALAGCLAAVLKDHLIVEIRRAERGMPRAARRRWLGACAGLAAAAGAVAVAVSTWPTGGIPAANAAAFTVTQGPHGTIVVDSREFLTKAQGAQLQRQLRAQGVPVNVYISSYSVAGPYCQFGGFPYPRGMWHRVFISTRIHGGRIVLVIRPAALAPGAGILLNGGPTTDYVRKPGEPVRKMTEATSLGWGFVKASPKCTGT